MIVLAFDVGGTHLRSGLLGDDLRLRGRRERATPRDGAAALLEALVAEAGALGREAGERPSAVGLAMAGCTDVTAGIVHEVPSLGLRDALVVPPLERALALPVRLVNDVNAAAWGEAHARGCRDLVAILVGTGVGTGFVSGGALLEGRHGLAAEGGHAVFRLDGPPCELGHRGCYQSYLGGAALAARAAAAGLPPDTAALVSRWRAGDPAASVLLLEAVAALESLCRLLVTLLDPERIVIGGGVARATPELLDAAARSVRQHPLTAAVSPVVVTASELGDDAGLIGAALLARARAEGRPAVI